MEENCATTNLGGVNWNPLATSNKFIFYKNQKSAQVDPMRWFEFGIEDSRTILPKLSVQQTNPFELWGIVNQRNRKLGVNKLTIR